MCCKNLQAAAKIQEEYFETLVHIWNILFAEFRAYLQYLSASSLCPRANLLTLGNTQNHLVLVSICTIDNITALD